MSTQDGQNRADVIVIGAGVLGTFHAYFAARKGLKTLLLERNTLPNDASVRNFGMLPQTIVDPAGPWWKYARASRDIYQSIQEEHDISLEPAGSLYLASTELEDAVLIEFAERYGDRIKSTHLDAGEVNASYPFVSGSYCLGALHFPDDLALEPRQMLARLIPYVALLDGVRYVPNTTVVSVASGPRECTVRDTRGNQFVAERVILCAGAEYRILFPEHLAASGLQVCKLQMMRTAPMKSVSIPHSVLSGLSIRRYPAFTSCPSYQRLLAEPTDHELRAFGIHVLIRQSADGTIVIGDSHEYRGPRETAPLEERTNPAINEAILRYARRMLDLPTWPILELWNGYYLAHPEAPIYTADIDERIHLVTGIGGKGMTTGPGFARESVVRLIS
ncbi:MAG TPA: TIGR03364 family FAD-dependent oxidoreductase [Chloroflexota bacterium]